MNTHLVLRKMYASYIQLSDTGNNSSSILFNNGWQLCNLGNRIQRCMADGHQMEIAA